MSTRRPIIPRLVAEVDVRSLPLTAVEGFVVSRIDGALAVHDLADLVSLDVSEIERIVRKLIELGAAEWADGTVSLPRAASGAAPVESTVRRGSVPPRAPPPRPNITESQAPSAIRQPAIPRARVVVPRPADLERAMNAPSSVGDHEMEPIALPPSDVPVEIDLPLERRQRIDELYPVLDLMNHYDVLGLETAVDVKAVRARYFELSKVFHPDTAFRRNLGGYKAKMEAIFARLTEAYEVLGKKKSRAEYDAYLELQGEFRVAEESLGEAPLRESTPPPTQSVRPGHSSVPPSRTASSSRAPSRALSSRAPSAQARSSRPPASGSTSRPTLSDEGRRRARELLERRLGAGRALGAQRTALGVSSVRPPPRGKDEIVRDLAHSLKSAASLTGGLDTIQRHALEARRREQAGDLAGATRELRFALALAPERTDLKSELDRVSAALAKELADKYMQAAIYEERHKKWAAAAASWCKVVDGRPGDADAAARAALALVEAQGDLHRAQKLAQQATDLRPEWSFSRFVLGRVFLAAGLHLNARRELERAATLDPADEKVKVLLRDLKP